MFLSQPTQCEAELLDTWTVFAPPEMGEPPPHPPGLVPDGGDELLLLLHLLHQLGHLTLRHGVFLVRVG